MWLLESWRNLAEEIPDKKIQSVTRSQQSMLHKNVKQQQQQQQQQQQNITIKNDLEPLEKNAVVVHPSSTCKL